MPGARRYWLDSLPAVWWNDLRRNEAILCENRMPLRCQRCKRAMVDDFVFADPTSFRGQLERGRGIAVHRAADQPDAADVIYRCVVEDSRWDHQVEERHSYLARLIHRLELALTPLEENLYTAPEAEDIWLTLAVLGTLPFVGRTDAADMLQRYAVDGQHWVDAMDAISSIGSWKMYGSLDRLADRIVGGHTDAELAEAVGTAEPWLTFARTQPRIAALLNDLEGRRKGRSLLRGPGPEGVEHVDLVERVYATRDRERRDALKELGRSGDLRLLGLAADPALRNGVGWVPGMPPALDLLGDKAVHAARQWVEDDDSTLVDLGIGVLSKHGDHRDGPVLLADVSKAVEAEAWCVLELPARGLGRIGYSDATNTLLHVWEVTVHSLSRAAVLEGLAGCSPNVAEGLAVEALDDCEEAVQRSGCKLAPSTPTVVRKLAQLRDDPLASGVHQAATE